MMNNALKGCMKGAIFDMDGVLVDSEKLYMRFWREASEAFGSEMSEEMALSLRSNSPETAVPKFLDWFGESADYYAIRELRRRLMADFIDQNGVDLKPGAAELLAFLRERGVKLALATASPVRRARHYLEPHGIFGLFDAVVSGASVARSKPAPDIYLAAADMLGLPPSECFAVEDSPAGVISTRTAGCFTVMVPDLTPPDAQTAGFTDLVVADLRELKERLGREITA